VEGDATLAMSLYAGKYIPVIDLFQSIYTASGVKKEALSDSPAFLQEMYLFPYEQGLKFVHALYESGGWAAVNTAYATPPQSTEQILHPERYRQKDEPQIVSLPDLAAGLGGGWRKMESDVLGELGLRLALAKHVGPAAAMQAAEGWGGDRYVLLQQGTDGPYALVMRTSWDDRNEADEFWTLYQTCMAHRVGYIEEVSELVGEVRSHWWLTENSCVLAKREGSTITIVVAKNKETVNQILKALASP